MINKSRISDDICSELTMDDGAWNERASAGCMQASEPKAVGVHDRRLPTCQRPSSSLDHPLPAPSLIHHMYCQRRLTVRAPLAYPVVQNKAL